MKCMIQERNKIILDEENLIWAKDQVRNVKRLSLRSLGKRSENLLREIGENERIFVLTLYIENHKARWIESCRALKHEN